MIYGGQSCALVGERRIGKSSLLVCLADPRSHQPWLEENEILMPISLDFLGFREIGAGDLWYEICDALAEAGGVRPPGEPSFTGVRRLLRGLTREGARIVLLCDEFELAVENPHLDEGFFGALRSLAASAGVAFVTASRLSLLELDQYRDEKVRRKVLGSLSSISSPSFRSALSKRSRWPSCSKARCAASRSASSPPTRSSSTASPAAILISCRWPLTTSSNAWPAARAASAPKSMPR